MSQVYLLGRATSCVSVALLVWVGGLETLPGNQFQRPLADYPISGCESCAAAGRGTGTANTNAKVNMNEGKLMNQLIAASMDRKMLWECDALEDNCVPQNDIPRYLHEIKTRSDYRSYHLLFALRKDYPSIYHGIPATIRASILCSALKDTTFLNDWGDLALGIGGFEDKIGLQEFQAGFQKFDAASALLAIGKPAIPCLLPILDDFSEAILEGSEEATVSIDCQYRRADWACLFASMILQIPYHFSEDPIERDQNILKLKNRLRREVKK